METVFVSLACRVKPRVRRAKLQNRDYSVVPTVMIVEGVHNGSKGPLYYPADEIRKSASLWDAKPVVIYHPPEGTACEPAVLNERGVGQLMRTRWSDGKLKTESWMDEARVKAVDGRVHNAIEAETALEGSTGLLVDVDPVEGEWNGEHYVGIARNLRPDHYAILPDQKGACSLTDGAGFLMNQESEDAMDENVENARGYFGHKGRPGHRGGGGGSGGGGGGGSGGSGSGSVEVVKSRTDMISAGPDPMTLESWESARDAVKAAGIKAGRGEGGSTTAIAASKNAYSDSVSKLESAGWQHKKAFVDSGPFSASVSVFEKDGKLLELVGSESESEFTLGKPRKNVENALGVANEQSYDSIRDQIAALVDTLHEVRVHNVYPDYAVFEQRQQLYKQGYEVKDDVVSLRGLPEPVVRVVSYKTKKGVVVNTSKEHDTMDKSKLVEELVGVKNGGFESATAEDRTALAAMSEQALRAMIVNAQAKAGVAEVRPPAAPKKPANLQEYLDTVPAEYAPVVRNGVAAYNRDHEALVQNVLKHPRNKYTVEQLRAKDLSELQVLNAFCVEEKSAGANDFGGQGGAPVVNRDAKPEDLLPLPVMNFEKK